MCACWRHPGNPNRINLGWKRMKKILSCFGLSAALGMLLFSTAWAEEPIETTTKDGVHLVWQYIGERIGYLAYHVQSSKSGIFELYWTCDGLRDDSKQEKHASNGATYIVNTVPNGPVEDTANVIVEKLPWADNQKVVLATTDWTNWRKGGTRETYAGEGSMTVLTPEPRKNIYINSQKALKPDDVFNKLPTDQPFKLLTFTLITDNEQKPEEHANPPISYMISVPKK